MKTTAIVNAAGRLLTSPRPIAVGKIHLDFYVKAKLESMPLTEIPGLPAPLAGAWSSEHNSLFRVDSLAT